MSFPVGKSSTCVAVRVPGEQNRSLSAFQQPPLKRDLAKSPWECQRDTKLVAGATLMYTVLTFPRSYRVIIRMLGCSLAGSAQRLYCNSFPPLSSHPFCNDTYNLMFSRKVGCHSPDTHTHTHTHTGTAEQLTGPVYLTNMGDVTGEERLFLFLLFAVNPWSDLYIINVNSEHAAQRFIVL